MSSLVMRALGAVLAVLGLVAVVVGGWFMSKLGSDGQATFSAAPGSRVVVLEPSVLNRVDPDVSVRASAGTGAVWMGLARPSDVEDVLEDAKVTTVTGVGVRDWELRTSTSGTGDADPQRYDLWQDERVGEGRAVTTVDQEAAPQTLVIAAEPGQTIDEVTMSVSDAGWFTRAVVLAIAGLVLLALGAYLVLRTLRRDRSEDRSDDGSRVATSDIPDRDDGDGATPATSDTEDTARLDHSDDPDDTTDLDEGYLRAIGKKPRAGSTTATEEDPR